MTTTPTGKAMTAERLRRIGKRYGDVRLVDPGRESTAIADILDHIDAQAAEIAALKAELATAREEGAAQAWNTALCSAANAVALFPSDTKESLHKFGAETVLRALKHVHAQHEKTRSLKGQTP